jgi:hypothetical protein
MASRHLDIATIRVGDLFRTRYGVYPVKSVSSTLGIYVENRDNTDDHAWWDQGTVNSAFRSGWTYMPGCVLLPEGV